MCLPFKLGSWAVRASSLRLGLRVDSGLLLQTELLGENKVFALRQGSWVFPCLSPTSAPNPRHLPIGVEHHIHEEGGDGGQRVRVQAGNTEPVAWAGEWVDDWSLDWKSVGHTC